MKKIKSDLKNPKHSTTSKPSTEVSVSKYQLHLEIEDKDGIKNSKK